MVMILPGVVAAMIAGSAAWSQHEPADRPKDQFEIPQSLTGAGTSVQSVRMEPYSELKYRNIVRQVYDYSCGSAALVTILKHHIGADVSEQQAMEGMLADGEPLREEMARRLMTSERTLQRRLAEEGTNFTKLVDDTRRRLAQQYLSRRDVSLKKTRFQLGFSDPSAFCRACKRWFGLSPRQLQRGPSPAESLLLRRTQAAAPNAAAAGRCVYVKPD